VPGQIAFGFKIYSTQIALIRNLWMNKFNVLTPCCLIPEHFSHYSAFFIAAIYCPDFRAIFVAGFVVSCVTASLIFERFWTIFVVGFLMILQIMFSVEWKFHKFHIQNFLNFYDSSSRVFLIFL